MRKINIMRIIILSSWPSKFLDWKFESFGGILHYSGADENFPSMFKNVQWVKAIFRKRIRSNFKALPQWNLSQHWQLSKLPTCQSQLSHEQVNRNVTSAIQGYSNSTTQCDGPTTQRNRLDWFGHGASVRPGAGPGERPISIILACPVLRSDNDWTFDSQGHAMSRIEGGDQERYTEGRTLSTGSTPEVGHFKGSLSRKSSLS